MNNDVIKIDELEFVRLIDHRDIQARVMVLSRMLSEKLVGKDPLFIIVLNGAFIFGADLVRQFDGECDIHFVNVKSYQGMSRGEFTMDINSLAMVKDRHVVIIEDIVDSGQTIHKILDACDGFDAKSVSVAAFLSKPSEWQYDLKVDFLGFEIPSLFVIGYGLDYNGKGRNLKHIYQIRPIVK